VLREFAEIAPHAGYDCEWLPATRALERSAAIQPQDLEGGLWSATELTVDPRVVISCLPEYLREIGVWIHLGHAVTRIELPRIETSVGCHKADAAIVSAGDDFETLFPAFSAPAGPHVVSFK
jgi:glycine/D-amino acid oxidase-like deaminating enzyme